MFMPNKVARILAADDAVGTEELEAVIHYLNNKLYLANINGEPVPFLTYRNRRIFEATLRIRTGPFAP
jgi:hypothetical protein